MAGLCPAEQCSSPVTDRAVAGANMIQVKIHLEADATAMARTSILLHGASPSRREATPITAETLNGTWGPARLAQRPAFERSTEPAQILCPRGSLPRLLPMASGCATLGPRSRSATASLSPPPLPRSPAP